MKRTYQSALAVCATIAIVVVLPAVCLSAEASWISGTARPPTWAVGPANPTTSDEVVFSGPTTLFLNKCAAENRFGGKPAIKIDAAGKKIELTFVPPASKGCSLWDPVCGLKGSLGKLKAGQWQLSGNCGGAVFSIRFTVTGEAPVAAYYVDATANGANDGTSWTNAFKHLRDALAAAAGGGETRVAQGVYRPDRGRAVIQGDPNTTFHLGGSTTIKGGYAGLQGADPNARDAKIYKTVLSGDLQDNDAQSIGLGNLLYHPSRADNCYHVITADGAGAVPSLDGLTVYGGNANGSDDTHGGGGIYIAAGISLTISNCDFRDNAVRLRGSAIYNGMISRVTLADCTFTGNWAGDGGVIFSDSHGRVALTRCTVSGNSAMNRGGAIYCYPQNNLVLSNCLIAGNSVTDPQSGAGGAIFTFAGTTDVNNCTLAGNLARLGSGLASYYMWPPAAQGKITIANSIIWNAGGNEIWNTDNSFIKITYSDLQDQWPGKGNIFVDPCFVNAGRWEPSGSPADPYDDVWVDGDYRPLGWSPCIDAGDLNYVPDPNVTDIVGGPRIRGPAVDMGAWEIKDDPPIADAGRDQVSFVPPTGKAQVTLDGSGSRDPEGMPLRYKWSRSGTQVATGVNSTLELSPGQYTFELIVNDGGHNSQPDSVNVNVAGIVAGTLTIVPDEIIRTSGPSKISCTLLLPPGFSTRDVDAGQRLTLHPGAVKAVGQSVFPWFGKVMIIASFDKGELLKALPANGLVEIQALGRLRDGRYFRASDTVIIR